MRVDQELIRKYLHRRDFIGLFNYLGWDDPATLQPFFCEGREVYPAAAKRGVGVWQIDGWPPAAARRRIDQKASERTRERLLIFDNGLTQHWLWPEKRPSGSGYRLVEHIHQRDTLNEALIQRLAGSAFSIEEEKSLTVMTVLNRVRRQFNAEPVTKRFYKDFRKHHQNLVGQIEGIEPDFERGWYGSVLLNRLMFIYFLQKKGFLENDYNYLRTRLGMVREYLGRDSFYGFFRDFLLPLFHDGLGSHLQRYDDPRIAEIVGGVPYVNGGIFSRHLLERSHDIAIPDAAFEQIFDFFDGYRWHLDERPTDDPNEINPDVLGYVFEQYVNQKEQGAYYTKEDITGYMTGVTVIPALLDRLDLDDDPMDLLTVDPDRYIYESVRYGVDEPLPAKIQEGVDDPDRRGDDWFEKAPDHIGLPGETWWETIDRHRRYRELRERVERGEITDVDSAITANLDLRILVTDFLGMLTPIEAVESAYRTLTELTVLDPTCGSGAFLFAVLDVLADCYEVLLDQAEELSCDAALPQMLLEADGHPNRSYFILKSAMLNNLYGVDIVPEAGEIARLRMFLKLAAQLTEPRQIEPLPDLDFNIKTGNLLVGIAHQKDAEERIGMDLLGLGKLESIEATNAEVAALMEEFSLAQQRTDDPVRILTLKAEVEEKLAEHRRQLDRNLYEARAEITNFDRWIASHQPFHWFIEFPGVFQNGGFDVIIGNPPFISRTAITNYKYQNYITNDLANIYAPCVERSLQLLEQQARFTMVLPISFQFSSRFTQARKVVTNSLSLRWISAYGKRPDRLFIGAQQRIAIIIGTTQKGLTKGSLFSTRFLRWVKGYRSFLFENLSYTPVPNRMEERAGWLKLGSPQENNILNHLLDHDTTILLSSNDGNHKLYYKAITYNYLSVFLDIPPAVDRDCFPIAQPKIGQIRFSEPTIRDAAFVFYLSKVALLWWAASGDGFNLTNSGLRSTPIPSQQGLLDALAGFAPEIRDALNQTLGFAKNANKIVGNYDTRLIRHLTDEVDKHLLEALGLKDHWTALQLFTAAFGKSTGRTSDLRPWSYYFPDMPEPPVP